MDHFDTFSVNTLRFRVEGKRWGPKKGFPIFALHGWFDNAASFDQIALALKQYSVYALDLPGHGYSESIPDGYHYHTANMVQTIVNVANLLQIEKFGLIGHSLGASIASLIASTCPGRVTKLVLLDSLGPLSEEADKAPARLGNSIETILKRANIKQPPKFPTIEAAIEAKQKETDLTARAVSPIVERGIKVAEDNEITWNYDPKLMLPLPFYFTEEQVQAFLSNIEADTLLVHGSSGRTASDPNTKARIDKIKKIETYELPGGHYAHLEYPAKIIELIETFLNK